MRKNRTVLLSLIAMMVTACGNQTSSSSAVSSPASPSTPSSSVSSVSSEAPVSSSSSSVGPQILEAPTIDKVADTLSNFLEVGLVEYEWTYRNLKRNFRTGDFMTNEYKTIAAKQYSNGVDAVETIYAPEAYESTSDNLVCSGPLRAYKLDDDYYVYGYTPTTKEGYVSLGNSFVEILERNRYNTESTMEFWSNGIETAFVEFNGPSGWDPVYGYVPTPYSAVYDELENSYYCKIGATAPETDRYGEEDNYAWVKMDAYTYAVEEVGVHMQVKIRQGTGDYAGQIADMTEVVVKNPVAGEREEGVIEPLSFAELPYEKVTDYRAKPVDLEEGEIDPNKVKDILRNLRCYTNGTNYAHRDFYEEAYDPDTYESIGYVHGYADAYAISDEAAALYTYLDKDNDPSTPHVLIQADLNTAEDDGIHCETYYATPVPGYYENGYKISSIASGRDIYSLNDFLNPNGYFISSYGLVLGEVARFGWGEYDNGWQKVNYQLNTHSYSNGVIDIEFEIQFPATDWKEAYSDVYVIQITDGFLNKIASKRMGSPYFDTWTNYKLVSPN